MRSTPMPLHSQRIPSILQVQLQLVYMWYESRLRASGATIMNLLTSYDWQDGNGDRCSFRDCQCVRDKLWAPPIGSFLGSLSQWWAYSDGKATFPLTSGPGSDYHIDLWRRRERSISDGLGECLNPDLVSLEKTGVSSDLVKITFEYRSSDPNVRSFNQDQKKHKHARLL